MNKLDHDHDSLDRGNIFIRPHIFVKEAFPKSFQFKILHNILPVNHNLHKWKVANTANCTFCQADEETSFQLFTECIVANSFWGHLVNFYSNLIGTRIWLTAKQKILGVENGDILLNYLIILGKLFLFRAKTEQKTNFRFFETIAKSKCTTEKEIAKTSGKRERFQKNEENIYLKSDNVSNIHAHVALALSITEKSWKGLLLSYKMMLNVT
jgi:hypothetical protein